MNAKVAKKIQYVSGKEMETSSHWNDIRQDLVTAAFRASVLAHQRIDQVVSVAAANPSHLARELRRFTVSRTIPEFGADAKRGAVSAWEKRDNLRNQGKSQGEKTRLAPPSTRRSVQFVATLYIHTLCLVIFAISSRNVFSMAIRTALLPLFL